MGEFFELRIYQVLPGKMIDWLELMENTIIPFQVSKGMIIHGSFTENSFNKFNLNNGKREMETLKNRNLYIWIRRFKNLDHKNILYKEVYESEEWIKNIAPIVETLIDRNTIVVHNLSPTALSIMK
tara:strand:+ start:894 stop:1271 length:378 start_codon:yes stop_codon:yes gene_type:complete